MKLPIKDRRAAGRALAQLLQDRYRDEDVVVLALPRGGVPVAAEVAAALGAPLDVLNVRKLGVPYRLELAMGAIASGGIRILNPEVIRQAGIDHDTLEEEADEVVCLATPAPFFAISPWYADFRQVGDEEVRRALRDAPVTS